MFQSEQILRNRKQFNSLKKNKKCWCRWDISFVDSDLVPFPTGVVNLRDTLTDLFSFGLKGKKDIRSQLKLYALVEYYALVEH